MAETTNTLLLIDCQRDFHPGGSLAIAAADDDARRIAALIRSQAPRLHRIVATMDSHQKLHIAHPCFWWSADGSRHPDPFTIITAEDIRTGTWRPRTDIRLPSGSEIGTLDASVFGDVDAVTDTSGHIDAGRYALEYATRLEARGRFKICIWPEHCLIGTPGHALVGCIQEALNEWSEMTGQSVEWVLKGQNIWTEMYSALEADVPVSQATAFNDALHGSLMADHNRLFVCGQAISHCVNYTLRDIVAKWNPDETNRICLLTDCASAVPGFEAAAETFISDMQKVGVQLKTANEVAAIL